MDAATSAARERATQPDEVVLPLFEDFQFTHEPLVDTDTGRFAARHAEVDAFTRRVLNARGGAYLVTGYRGVGKTSFVNQVVGRIRTALQARTAVEANHTEILLDVPLNLPVETRPTRLMHLIVRRLYERLFELRLLPHLDARLRQDLELAYTRTSFKLAQKRTEGLDLSLGNSLEWNALGFKFGMKSPVGAKRSRSSVYEASFLGYDELAAEGDIVSLGRRLTGGKFRRVTNLRSRMLRHWRKQSPQTFSLRIVFVFDELDKLEYGPGENRSAGDTCLPVERHLRTLKSLFTTSGFTFIFVAGRDMHDHWLREASGGDSVFESVFSWDYYVPCLWEETRLVCDRVVDFRSLAIRPCPQCPQSFEKGDLLCRSCGKYLRDRRAAFEAYERFVKYLCFRGRGLTRLALRSLHNWVDFRDGKPYLVFDKRDLRRHRAFADLWDRLLAAEEKAAHNSVFGLRSNVLDRNRLACLYFFDWLLQTGNAIFTATDAAKAVAQFSGKIAPESGVGPMLDVAVKVGLIELLPDVTGQAQIGAHSARYTLASRWRIDIGQENEEESPGSAGTADRAGKYRMDRLIARGGMSEVHLGFDLTTRRVVALKLLITYDDSAAARFRQEIAILRSCRHPHLVQFFGEGSINGRQFFAMEYIDGEELKGIIEYAGALDPAIALYIARCAADALAHLHSRNIIRMDVKPSNVMLTVDGRVVVIDLGIAKPLVDSPAITAQFMVIGTPLYMAPEQISGQPAGTAADVYSFGVLLYEMLTGRPLRNNAIAFQQAYDLPPAVNSGHSVLDALTTHCLQTSPADRPSDMMQVFSYLPAPDYTAQAALGELIRRVRAARKQSPHQRTSERAITRMESHAPEQEAPPSAPPPSTLPPAVPSATPQPGEFTRMFGNPQAKQPGEFTRMFMGPPTPEQGSPATPPPFLFAPEAANSPPSSTPHTPSFTAIFSGSTPPGSAPPATSVMLGASEYTAMFTPGAISPYLTVEAGPALMGNRLKLLRPRTRMGRAPDNDLCLDADEVSRNHAEIVVGIDAAWIEDLGAALPTLVNGALVRTQQKLIDGALITIGPFQFRYSQS